MKTLRKAREEGSLEDFIREREADAEGDLDKLDAALTRPAQGTGKAVPAASPKDDGDG